MAEQLTLCIQTPFKKESLTIEWVQVHSPTGSFVVGPGHAPLVSALAAQSSLIYRCQGKDVERAVGEAGGLLHVGENVIQVFL